MIIQVYRSLGQPEKGREAAAKGVPLAERELMLHPEDPRPAVFGVTALIELGEYDRAREWIRRGLAIDPDDPSTLYNSACAYAKLGDHDEALDLLERVLKHGARTFRDWIAHDSDMDPLRNNPRFQRLLA